MMLMVVLWLIVPAHAYGRNQDPTTLPPLEPERRASTDVRPERPVREYDQLDEIAMLVYGHNVSMIQYLYSVTNTEESYRGKPAFDIFNERAVWWRESEYVDFYKRVHMVFLSLAKSDWTRSQAKESLIKKWQKVRDHYYIAIYNGKNEHPALLVLDDMARAQAR
ncbi:hypothetical protein GCK32_017531 [Trichostrongylus colubriformis]|uniref:Uncharacterized protein n=1 Tax=Trichostrongylus colubriformis TaxID=6319 RepID=A0AAN8F418_TRICO